MSTSLLQLRNACKDAADMSGSASSQDSFIPDETWNQYINASFAEMHDLILKKDVMFFVTSSKATVITGNTISLPADLIFLKGVDRSLDGSGNAATWYNVPKRQFKERNWGNNSYFPVWLPPVVGYTIVADTLLLTPALNASGLYQIWYYPTAPVLVSDSDTFDDRYYWYQYVIEDVAIKALEKEESFEAAAAHAARKESLKNTIEEMGSDRDFGQPMQVGNRSFGGNSGFGSGGSGGSFGGW